MEDETYLENLAEYVFDENRLVTYRWLSQTLSVHVNEAKQMLYRFVKEQENAEHLLKVTYLLSGWISPQCPSEVKEALQISVVNDTDFEEAKAKFERLMCCHVYSVQKTGLVDGNVLFMTDFEVIKQSLKDPVRYSAIHCKSATPSLKPTSLSLPAIRLTAENEEKTTMQTAQAEAPGADKSSTKTTKSKTGIAGMFARAEKKSPVKPDKHEAESGKATSKVAPAKGIAKMFANQVNKQSSKPVTVKDQPMESTKALDNDAMEPTNLSSSCDIVIDDVKENGSEVTWTKIKEKKTTTKEKRKREKKTPPAHKESTERKHKRIRVFSSESEEDNEDQPVSPDPPSPPPVVEGDSRVPDTQEALTGTSTSKKTRRKLVSKTFMDAQGFMVTEKVLEDCSESEDNEVIPPTPEPVVKTTPKAEVMKGKKKKPSPGKSKQASLMNFFKKT